MKTPKEVIQSWVDAFNKRDFEVAASLYHQDAENIQMAIGIPLKGQEAIKKDLKDFFEHVPDNFTNIEHLFEDGEWAILEWSGGGTFKIDKDTEGRKFTLRGCGFFHVVQGKIKFQRGYWDKATWFKQVGIPIE